MRQKTHMHKKGFCGNNCGFKATLIGIYLGSGRTLNHTVLNVSITQELSKCPCNVGIRLWRLFSVLLRVKRCAEVSILWLDGWDSLSGISKVFPPHHKIFMAKLTLVTELRTKTFRHLSPWEMGDNACIYRPLANK